MIYKYIVFDAGAKKIARYQQFFTVQDILHRVRSAADDAPREGGVRLAARPGIGLDTREGAGAAAAGRGGSGDSRHH